MAQTAILDIMKLFALCQQALEERGIGIEESSDFAACEARMRAIGKMSVTPMLSSDYHDLSRDNAAWLILQKDGHDIGGVAARHDLLISETLSNYWARSYARLYKGKGALRAVPDTPRPCDEIRGKVVYTGEFFIASEMRGSRHLLSLYTHLLFSYCHLRWHPDWLYAFVRARDARRGYAAEYGFTRQYPGAHFWQVLPDGRATGEYLVAIQSGELSDMASYFACHTSCLLGEDSLRRVE